MPPRYRCLPLAALLPVFLALGCGGGDGGTEPSPDFSPATDTTLIGVTSYRSVTIPAGVTVTSSQLNLTVSQDLLIAGTLRAPCGQLRLNVTGAVTITGAIDNGCPIVGDSGGSLKIIGQGSWSLNGATITTAGDFSIVNNPADLLNVASLTLPADHNPRAAAVGWRCQIVQSSITVGPATRRRAEDSAAVGKNGRAGATRLFVCGHSPGQAGGSLLLESSTIVAGSGGDAGTGLTSISGQAQGGLGGSPGGIIVIAEDDIDLRGAVSLTGGNGGNGGNATPTAPNGNPGGNAAATGGKGADLIPQGFSAPVKLEAGGTISQTGTLTIALGRAGNGGSALAIAGAGIPAIPGGAGGNATGTGGVGGNGATVELTASGAITLNGQVNLTGGAGGSGGDANCRGGLGGPGSLAGAAGGRGGNMTCRGGPGGRGMVGSGGVLSLNSAGGSGGDATVSGAGNGGFGASSCGPTGLGGSGGAGGSVTANAGIAGTGSPSGTAGTVEIVTSANGGRGGNGVPPGSGGGAGANISSNGAALLTDSFAPGLSGAQCPAGVSGFGLPGHQSTTMPSRIVRGGTR